jgi:tetratricopeptide (TPR) repeat protein
MKAFVFTDAALERHAGQFVWLAIDGEKAKNVAIVKKLKIAAYPTLYILDPTTENVAVRWIGGATVPQLHGLFDQGRHVMNRSRTGLDGMVARADSLYGEGADSLAALAYQEVLAQAPKDWPDYPRVMDATLFSLDQSGNHSRCVELAREAMEKLKGTTSGANAAVSGLSAALQLPAENPQRKELVALFEARCREDVENPAIALSTDDRSGIYLSLADAREDAKDEEGRKAVLAKDAELLEKAAAAAKTSDQRAVFDPHRLAVYRELKQPEKAVDMLKQSEKDFPKDYNPPARLAVAYLDLKKLDDALAASDRALARAYGPRKLGIFNTRVGIFVARGDSTSARGVLETAIKEGEALPEGQRPNGQIANLKKRLTAFGGTPPTAQN